MFKRTIKCEICGDELQTFNPFKSLECDCFYEAEKERRDELKRRVENILGKDVGQQTLLKTIDDLTSFIESKG
jgi:hypothetical protein